MRVTLDRLTVDVDQVSEGVQPWEPNAPCWRYHVAVVAEDGATYEADAYGSQHDYESGSDPWDEAEAIGYMVVDELLMAVGDPDEFFRIATEGAGGRERAATILALIDAAETMADVLWANADAVSGFQNA